ncbi:MAG: four helix bundle protein [Desulfobulbaceae bacterium]|jgi:four helix bundle protein|nr:four helix bundle protein [Desulfobulbaceae bacterium]MDH3866255.1 four helix bundle protein [Desulfobulbaceae bacterium]MDH3995532.1 four helix bundle protein [Desulfobulbaceae bacterium]
MDKPHKNLIAWQLAMDIAEEIYSITESFPAAEKFGLVSQMRRCAISVPSNIAEGAGRHTKKEFVNFLHISQGSLSELDTQIELSLRLRYIDENTWTALNSMLIEEDKIISGLIRSQKKAG